MKTRITWMMVAALAMVFTACGPSYKKTKTGLVYKLISGNSKDSAAKNGNVVKLHFIRKLNDSVMYNSFDKMPSYIPVQENTSIEYSPLELFTLLRKGDSLVTVEMFDTLVKKGMTQQLPATAKKGDRITTYIKILEIFKTDSLAMPDYQKELARDKPRQEKEMKEIEAKETERRKEQYKKDLEEWKKSGEIEKENKEVEAYLAKKNISAVKAPGGTYVLVKQKGNGEPVTDGKFLTVKYSGRLLPSDSAFESSVYIFPVGQQKVIAGWDDGLKLFNKGGTGTLYVPGYLAYGKGAGPGGKAFEPLIFDVEVVNITDTREQAETARQTADSLSALKKTAKTGN